MFNGIINTTGHPARVDNVTDSIAIGADAGALFGSDDDNNIAIGARALDYTSGDANANIAIGTNTLSAVTSGDSNIALGTNAGQLIVSTPGNVCVGQASFTAGTGGYNTAVGYEALTAAVDVDNVVAIGQSALHSAVNLAIDGSVAVGRGAGEKLVPHSGGNAGDMRFTGVGHKAGAKLGGTTDGQNEGNVIIGYDAMAGGDDTYTDNTAGFNTVVGAQALGANVADGTALTAGNNVVLGFQAGYNMASSTDCVVIGRAAGTALTSGLDNVAIGTNAMDASSITDRCIAIGTDALGAMAGTDGSGNNIAIGYQAADALTTGINNIAIGTGALGADTTGSSNVIIGHEAGRLLTIGNLNEGADQNVAIGGNAMYNAAGGNSRNTAVGYTALNKQNSADATPANNVAMGYGAGYYVSTGAENCLIGSDAGRGVDTAHLTGSNNTCLGNKAGFELEGAAHSNTFVGMNAGNTTETGTGNTIVGFNCETDNDTRVGSIVIGNSHNLQTASDNVFEVGNASNYIKYDLDSGDITITSDRRVKKDIVDTDLGLDFVNKLKPVKYKFRPNKDYAKEFGIDEEFIIESLPKEKAERVHDGLIAQDVKEVIDEMGISFSGWGEDIVGRQRLGYTDFIAPLIKAVQELSAQIEELKSN